MGHCCIKTTNKLDLWARSNLKLDWSIGCALCSAPFFFVQGGDVIYNENPVSSNTYFRCFSYVVSLLAWIICWALYLVCRLFKNYQQDCVSFPLFKYKPAFRSTLSIISTLCVCVCIVYCYAVVANVNQTSLRCFCFWCCCCMEYTVRFGNGYERCMDTNSLMAVQSWWPLKK